MRRAWNDTRLHSLPRLDHGARGHRHTGRLFDPRRFGLLSRGQGTGYLHCRGADGLRSLRQFRASRRAALHRRRQHHECRLRLRTAVEVLRGDRRAFPRRARPCQRRVVADLLRHVGIGSRGCGRRRTHRHRHDAQERTLFRRICRGSDGGFINDRPDHPPIDPDGALRARLQYVRRLPLPRRHRAGADHGAGAHGDECDPCFPQPRGQRGPGPDPGDPEDHASGIPRAADAGDPAIRHLRRRHDADGGRRDCRCLCPRRRRAGLSVAVA